MTSKGHCLPHPIYLTNYLHWKKLHLPICHLLFKKILSEYFYIYQHKNIVFAYISAQIYQRIYIYLHVDIAFTYISAILPTCQPRWMSFMSCMSFRCHYFVFVFAMYLLLHLWFREPVCLLPEQRAGEGEVWSTMGSTLLLLSSTLFPLPPLCSPTYTGRIFLFKVNKLFFFLTVLLLLYVGFVSQCCCLSDFDFIAPDTRSCF